MASYGHAHVCFRLMYSLRRLYAIRYLGFVDDGIKGPNLPFSFSFSRIPLSGVSFIISSDFQDAHGDHCTATVYIHFISFLLCISILEKLYFLLLHVESNRFLALEVLELLLLVWCCCCWRERKEGARVATTVATGGSFRVTFKPTNKVEIFKQVSKLPLPISFHLSPVAA
jgi:hypothetical protein